MSRLDFVINRKIRLRNTSYYVVSYIWGGNVINCMCNKKMYLGSRIYKDPKTNRIYNKRYLEKFVCVGTVTNCFQGSDMGPYKITIYTKSPGRSKVC